MLHDLKPQTQTSVCANLANRMAYNYWIIYLFNYLFIELNINRITGTKKIIKDAKSLRLHLLAVLYIV
jgi:hypothetical protein